MVIEITDITVGNGKSREVKIICDKIELDKALAALKKAKEA
jgi:hypothetical protein